LVLDFMGITLAFHTDSPEIADAVRAAYGDCLGWTDRARIEARVGYTAHNNHTNVIPAVEAANGRIRVEASLVEATVDHATGNAEIWITRWEQDPELVVVRAIEKFIMSIFPLLAIEHDALMVHCSGIVRDGRGYAFFAPSGTGKSTLAAASHALGYQTLSDDLNCLVLRGDEVILQGLPFRRCASPVPVIIDHAPLAGLYRIHQSPENRLEPVLAGVGVALLADQIPFVNRQEELLPRLLDLCTEIVRRVPVQALYLRKGGSFWQIL
jgi:hypothetical protein